MKNKIYSTGIILLLIVLVFYSFNFSERAEREKSPLETYSEVKVTVNSALDIETLDKNGIDIDHYIKTSRNEIKLVLNQVELAKLKSTGLGYNVTIPDLDVYYRNRPAPTEADLIPSREIMQKDGVDGLSYGSMGGFYTYAEVVEKLDSMRLLYPNLITAKINTGTSHENRTIWAVKISDNPEVYSVSNKKGIISSVRVVKKGNRYRFEKI